VRPWTLLGVAIATAIMAAVLFGACSGGGRLQHRGVLPGTGQPSPGATPTESASAQPLLPNATPPASGSAASRSDAGDALDAGAQNLAATVGAAPPECRNPTARLLLPDGGVVFNNAMTSADAGYLDRTQGVLEALGAQADLLRCCFDPWSRDTPGGRGQLLVVLDLEPDGRLRNASVEAERSTISRPDAVRCVLDVMRRAAFPASPTGKPTLVEFPLQVVGGTG
jgi:hypothetical protein